MMINQCEYLKQQILSICDNEYEYFFYRKNVVGVGMGYKVVKGYCTGEICIKVFVYKKINANQLNYKDLIPLSYKGIKTDVVDGGIFKPCKLISKVRPTIGGYCIGPVNPPKIISGTLGALVTDDNNYYILSNNHIIADENRIPIGTAIVQPSTGFGGIASKDTVAYLSKYIPLQFKTSFHSAVNQVDCAIAKVLSQSLVSPKVAFIGEPAKIGPPKLGTKVLKVGFASEITYGVITTVGTTLDMAYNRGRITFKNQIITTLMTLNGDSGALLMETNKTVVGLATGSSNTYSVSNTIYDVLNLLKVRLVTR